MASRASERLAAPARTDGASAVRRIVAMEVVSGIGDGVFWVALAGLLLDRGAGVGGLALAAGARLGPRAVLSAPAGVLADRVDRRRLLIGLDVSRGALMAVLAVAAAAQVHTLALLAIVLGVYTLAAPYRPALTAALPAVTGEARLSSANAVIAAVRQVMTFVGPLLGAAALRWASPTFAFAIDAASFAVSAALIAAVPQLRRLGGADGRGAGAVAGVAAWRSALASGWREVVATPGLTLVTALVFAMYAARGAETVLLVLLAEQRLGLGSGGIGVLMGAVGLGALCMLPLASRVAATGRPAVVLSASLATTALPFAVLAATRSWLVACVALVVLGGGVVTFEMLSTVLLQRLSRRDVLGRVFGLVGTCSNAGKLAGALLAAPLVALAGLGGAMAWGGVALAAVTVVAVPRLVSLARIARARGEQLREVVDVLGALAVFRGASRAALERIAASLQPMALAAGATVVREGDPADDLYVVRAGAFDVTDQGVVINTMGPDDWFGEIGLLQRRPRTATVTATSAAQLWRIPGDAFLDTIRESAGLPTAVFEVMSERLARSARQG